MKMLVDMNLSPRWIEALNDRGIEAVHWITVGASGAGDDEIMRYAESHGFTVLTRDMDFSAILAATGGKKPSVIQIRAAYVSLENMLAPVVDAINAHVMEIDYGTVITVDAYKTRVHILPFNHP